MDKLFWWLCLVPAAFFHAINYRNNLGREQGYRNPPPPPQWRYLKVLYKRLSVLRMTWSRVIIPTTESNQIWDTHTYKLKLVVLILRFQVTCELLLHSSCSIFIISLLRCYSHAIFILHAEPQYERTGPQGLTFGRFLPVPDKSSELTVAFHKTVTFFNLPLIKLARKFSCIQAFRFEIMTSVAFYSKISAWTQSYPW